MKLEMINKFINTLNGIVQELLVEREKICVNEIKKDRPNFKLIWEVSDTIQELRDYLNIYAVKRMYELYRILNDNKILNDYEKEVENDK